jgi:hypothetical protein
MAQITGKELSGISDLLSMEQNIADKYRAYEAETDDSALKDLFGQNAAEHKRHMDELWSNLK